MQATATKLGIYRTCPSRSSIYFLARCSYFYKPLKKIRNLSFQLGLRGRNDLRMGQKLANFQFFFSVQGTGGSPTGPGAENRVDDQDIRSTDRPASCGLGVPREPDNFHAKTRLSSWISRGVFPTKYPSIAPTEMSNTPGS